jgi:hypothetical protein
VDDYMGKGRQREVDSDQVNEVRKCVKEGKASSIREIIAVTGLNF